MPLSSRTSNLPNRYKGAATAAFLLVLLVAVLPFLFSSEVPASVSVPIANAASDGGNVVNVDGSIEPRGLGTAFNLTDAVQTEASLDVQPNPVAVGDNVLFTLTVSPSPPTSNDRFGNLTLLVARPDGTAEILGPFQSEPNGRIVVNYSPGLIGSYSIQLTYGGQFFTSSNITYLGAMSPETTLVVSSDGVPVPRTEGTWIVDDDGPADFHTIQAAINAASNGDTVLVRSGNYAENVVVNKTILLVGQAGEPRPRILGNRTVAVVKITANNVSMIGFEAINGGYGDSYGDGMLGGGIELFGVNDCIITKNNV